MSEASPVSQFGAVPSFVLAQPPPSGGAQAGQQIEQFGKTIQSSDEQLTSARRSLQIQQLHAQAMNGLLSAQFQALQQQDPTQMENTYLAGASKVRAGVMDQAQGDSVVAREMEARFNDMVPQFQRQINRHAIYLQRIDEESRVTQFAGTSAQAYPGLDVSGRVAVDSAVTDQINNNPLLNDAKRIALMGQYKQQRALGMIEDAKGKLPGMDDKTAMATVSELDRFAASGGLDKSRVTDAVLYAASAAAAAGNRPGVERWGDRLKDTAPKQYQDLLDHLDRQIDQNNAAAVPKIYNQAATDLNSLYAKGNPAPFATMQAAVENNIRPHLGELKAAMGDKYPGDDQVSAELAMPLMRYAASTGNQALLDGVAPIVGRTNQIAVDEARQETGRVQDAAQKRGFLDTADDISRGVILGTTDPVAGKTALDTMLGNGQLTPEEHKKQIGLLGEHDDTLKMNEVRRSEVINKLSGKSSAAIDQRYNPQIVDVMREAGAVDATRGVFENMKDWEQASQIAFKVGQNPLVEPVAKTLNGDNPDPKLAAYFARMESMSPAMNAQVYKQLKPEGVAAMVRVKDLTAQVPPLAPNPSTGKLESNPAYEQAVQQGLSDTRNIEVPQLQRVDIDRHLWGKDKQQDIGPIALAELNSRIPKELKQGASPILNLGFMTRDASGQASLALANEFARSAAQKYPVYLGIYHNEDKAKDAALDNAATQALWTHGPIVWKGVNFGSGPHTLPYDQTTELLQDLIGMHKAGKLPDNFDTEYIQDHYFPVWDSTPGKAKGSTQTVGGAWRFQPRNGETRPLMIDGAEYRFLPRKSAMSSTEYGQYLSQESQKRQGEEATRFDQGQVANDGMTDR